MSGTNSLAAAGLIANMLPLAQQPSEKSTATAAQELRIVQALMSGPKTTDELRAAGCYQVSARIWGLRSRGYNIVTDLFNGYAADGYSHARMARYTLVEEADGGCE